MADLIAKKNAERKSNLFFYHPRAFLVVTYSITIYIGNIFMKDRRFCHSPFSYLASVFYAHARKSGHICLCLRNTDKSSQCLEGKFTWTGATLQAWTHVMRYEWSVHFAFRDSLLDHSLQVHAWFLLQKLSCNDNISLSTKKWRHCLHPTLQCSVSNSFQGYFVIYTNDGV